MFIKIDNFEIMKSDLGFEKEYEDVFSFNIDYLVQKVVGHDLDIFCTAFIEFEYTEYGIEILHHWVDCAGVEDSSELEEIKNRLTNLLYDYSIM